MVLPKRLKIGGHIIKIKIVSANDIPENESPGFWSIDENIIYIEDKLPQSQQEVSLIHEILHVFNAVSDHEKLEFLAQALYQVLKDNNLYFGKEIIKPKEKAKQA